MLVLTRKKDQTIEIGDDVVVRVLRVKEDGTVQLGIDAPRSVNIRRGELPRNQDKRGPEETPA